MTLIKTKNLTNFGATPMANSKLPQQKQSHATDFYHDRVNKPLFLKNEGKT